MFTRISISRSFTKSQWFSFSTASRGHVGHQAGTQTGTGGQGTDRGRLRQQDVTGRTQDRGLSSVPHLGMCSPHHSPCTTPHGYCRARTSLFPTFTSSVLPTTAKGRCAWKGPRMCEHRAERGLARCPLSGYLFQKYPWDLQTGEWAKPTNLPHVLGCSFGPWAPQGPLETPSKDLWAWFFPKSQPWHPAYSLLQVSGPHPTPYPVKLRPREASVSAQYSIPPVPVHRT